MNLVYFFHFTDFTIFFPVKCSNLNAIIISISVDRLDHHVLLITERDDWNNVIILGRYSCHKTVIHANASARTRFPTFTNDATSDIPLDKSDHNLTAQRLRCVSLEIANK